MRLIGFLYPIVFESYTLIPRYIKDDFSLIASLIKFLVKLLTFILYLLLFSISLYRAIAVVGEVLATTRQKFYQPLVPVFYLRRVVLFEGFGCLGLFVYSLRSHG